jgi:hypothetical protein
MAESAVEVFVQIAGEDVFAGRLWSHQRRARQRSHTPTSTSSGTVNGRAAIAKFPSVSGDDWDVTAWEAVAIELARGAGIRVPTAQLHQIDGKSVLVVERFDRDGARRIGYVSAMTMLEANDGL